MKMKIIENKSPKTSDKTTKKFEYPDIPVGRDGKFLKPFIIVITDENGDQTRYEIYDPLEAYYFVTVFNESEVLKQELKKMHAFVRKQNLKIVDDD